MFKIGQQLKYNQKLVYPETLRRPSKSKLIRRIFESNGYDTSIFSDSRPKYYRHDAIYYTTETYRVYEKPVVISKEIKEGIYCGYKRKKLRRIYGSKWVVSRATNPFQMTVEKPVRLDKPFNLQRVALIACSDNRMIEVPMINVYRCYNNLTVL